MFVITMTRMEILLKPLMRRTKKETQRFETKNKIYPALLYPNFRAVNIN